MFKPITITLEESQRQIVLLALAKLSIERPGWLDMIEEIALMMDNKTVEGKPELLHAFRSLHQDPLLALEKSLKLQAHYAILLNAHDGGKRRQFHSPKEWIDRLIETNTLRAELPIDKIEM